MFWQSLRSWLKSQPRTASHRRRSIRRRPINYRPYLEALEGRLAPATLSGWPLSPLSPPHGTGAPAVSTFLSSGLNVPAGLAFDAAGNLYVANSDTILKVTPAGAVSTFVSKGLDGADGLAFDAASNLYVSNYYGNTILKVTPAGAVSTFVSSGLDYPIGLAFDAAGNLYVANGGYSTILKVTPTGAVSTFVSSGIFWPGGLAFDAAGNLYVNNSGTRMSKVTPAGAVSTFVSSGLDTPAYMAFDPAGNLFVANRDNNTISEVTPAGAVSTFVRSGLDGPFGLGFDAAGNIYVSNQYSNTIFKITPAPVIEGQTFSGTVFHFTDANPNDTASDYTAVVTLGDGNTVKLNSNGVVGSGPAGAGGQIVADAGGGFDVQLFYTYTEAFSNHTFSVQVTAGDGASTSASTSTFSVADAPLTGSTTATAGGTAGVTNSSVLSGATFTDGNPGNHTSDFTATITWGDGGPTSPGTVSYNSSSGTYTVNGSHTYAKVGNYSISIAVVDIGGSTGTITGTATVAPASANTIGNPSFETKSVWIASVNDPNGDHSEGYTTAWASDGTQSYEFTRSAGTTSAGSWVGISQTVNLTNVSGLLFDCQDTGIDGVGDGVVNHKESLQFLVDGTVVGQWANDGWPIGTVVDPTNPSNWGHTATTYNIEIPFSTAFTGNHTLTIREYTASSYWPADPKIYDIDNIREVNSPLTLTLSPSALPSATANHVYNVTIGACGGSGLYSFSLAPGNTLPPGLTLNSSGVLGGTPTTAGSYSFTIVASDTNIRGLTGSLNYSLTVNPALAIGPAALATATVGNSFSVQLNPTGGSGKGYYFAAVGLPSWLTLTSAGLLSGTPTTALASPLYFVVSVTDSNASTTSHAYALRVDPALVISPNTLPVATVGNKFSTQLTGAGGSDLGYTFTASGLPSWLTLTSAGLLSGTPPSGTGSPLPFTVTVSDSLKATGSTSYKLTIDPALTLGPSTLPMATVGNSFSEQLTAGGGSGQGYTFMATGLPSWSHLTSAGLLIGTPTTTAGSPLSFTVTVSNSNAGATSHTYSLTVDPVLTISTASLPTATVGDQYHTQLTATGGSSKGYTFKTIALPSWLTLTSAGLLSGTPPSGTGSPVSFAVTVTDSTGAMGGTSYKLTIDPALTLGPSALSVATVVKLFSEQLTAGGGSGGGYTFTATGLPSWLAPSSTGLLSGTPATTAGSPLHFTVTVRDSDAGTASQAYSLTVDPVIEPLTQAINVI